MPPRRVTIRRKYVLLCCLRMYFLASCCPYSKHFNESEHLLWHGPKPARQSQRLWDVYRPVCPDLEIYCIPKQSPIRLNQRSHVQDMRQGHHPVSITDLLKKKELRHAMQVSCVYVCVKKWEREQQEQSATPSFTFFPMYWWYLWKWTAAAQCKRKNNMGN